jgi:two-component system, NtrC family, response regulator HydG
VNYIAIVDDDREMGRLVKDIIESEGWVAEQFTSAAEALLRFKKGTPQVLITDLKMKDVDGMMLLRKVQTDFPNVVSLMMTAFGSIETAIEAMKAGAFHYIIKPFRNDELVLITRRAVEQARLTKDNKVLRQELKKTFAVDDIIGKSVAMQEVFTLIRQVAPVMANILISGESGTGKEIIARAIHNSGPRRNKPFIAINVTAIPEALLESELFGHVKGSFTGAVSDKRGLFQEAAGGTLFLDEIGDMSLPLQAKLLRVIQEKELRPVGGNSSVPFTARIITATHRDLKMMSTEGRFREDLFYRLNVIPIRIPPLRERPSDIPLLVEYFMSKFVALNGASEKTISPEAVGRLMSHPWPGNVRELENVIERAVVLSNHKIIDVSEIMDGAQAEAQQSMQQVFDENPTLEKMEERYIKLILGQAHYRKEEAAKILGISRRTLYRKERSYGLISEETDEPEETVNAYVQ